MTTASTRWRMPQRCAAPSSSPRAAPSRGVNPRVGCVILLAPHGEVSPRAGTAARAPPHAEVDALSKLAPGAAEGATAVVTLEPCNHTGRTGPCAVALIEAGIARVVYAVSDPGDHSAGGAAAPARRGRRGRRPACSPTRPRPCSTTGCSPPATAAARRDREVGGEPRRPRRRGRRHQPVDHRARPHGPTCTGAAPPPTRSRSAPEPCSPTTRRSPRATPAGEFYDAQPMPVVFGAPRRARRRVDHASPARAHVRRAGTDLVGDARRELQRRGIRSLFIEGGPTLASAFIAAGLVDELLVYLAPALLGGPRLALGDLGIASIDDAQRFHFTDIERLGDDVLLVAHPISSAAPRASTSTDERN